MRNNTKQIIERIGETDQLFLAENTPELALERANLRLELVKLSSINQEKIHFLQEAIVLLEQVRFETEEMPMQLYLKLSLELAKAYMIYFEITGENRFGLIVQQILKPMTSHNHGDIFFLLAYASAAKKEIALTRHWLSKYRQTAEFDLARIEQHPTFSDLVDQNWLLELANN